MIPRKSFLPLAVIGLFVLAGLVLTPPASAQATPDEVYVAAMQSFGNGTTCSSGAGTKITPVLTSDGAGKYKWVYTYHVNAGSGTVTVTDCLPVKFTESNANDSSANQQYTYTATGVSGAAWSDSSFTVQDSTAASHNIENEKITLNTGLLHPGFYTYTPTVAYTSCTGSGCTDAEPTLIAGVLEEIFDGKVEIDIYVDGLDTLDIKAGDSTGASGPNTPAKTDLGSGSGPYQWQYAYSITAGDHVADTLPIKVCVYDSDSAGDDPGLTADSYEVGVSYDTTDSSLNALSPSIDSPVTLDDGLPGCGASIDVPSSIPATIQTVNVSFDSGTLNTPGDYTIFFTVSTNTGTSSHSGDISYDDCTDLTSQATCGDSDQNVVVLIHVEGAPPPSGSCFLTDGEFVLLSDCGGYMPGQEEYLGPQTFQIVPGGKGGRTIVSTNPGQFFLSTIYKNDTASPVTIFFQVTEPMNLLSHGARPAHAATFDDHGFVADEAGFDAAQTGTPCSNPVTTGCTFTVPADSFIWIVWHATYDQIGQSTSGLSKQCQTDINDDTGTIGATLVIKENDSSGGVLSTCTLEAEGNLKH
jgi:hypothetical protein